MSAAWAALFRRGGGLSVLKLGMTVFVVALVSRLVFGWLIADTYDYDEFVLLLLARDFAHGDVPYRDFMFFHPPGALVLLRAIEPLTSLWWPAARIATSIIDSATSTVVFIIGLRVFDKRTGFAAGLVYAVSPLALVSAVRVGQDPLVTAFGTLAVALLLIGPKRRWAVATGVCLCIAAWIKYPGLYFVPVCLLISPRRFPFVVLGGACTLAALLFPFVGQAHALYTQTVTFQHTRWAMAMNQRLGTTAFFWIALNALAMPALIRRVPAWLLVAFALGGLFVFTPQVYYHYFVPVVPFASLLGGRTLTGFRSWGRHIAAAAMLLSALLVAAIIDLGGHSPLYVTAARLSEVQPTVQLLDQRSSSGESVLADRFEYAYLAHRPALAHYFWNVGVLVNARYLESRVHAARAVVLSSGASSGYPTGFTEYLNKRYNRLSTPTTYVWFLPRTDMRR
jgi:hypothetical protein